jgi:3-phosphoinositide dependent protein kinase-1
MSSADPSKPSSDTETENKQSQAQANAQEKRTVEHFSFGTQLGEGSYSTVVIGTEKANGQRYAIKILNKKQIIQQKKIQYVNLEKNVLLSLSHPFIIKLYYTFQDAYSLYFVLELARNGDLLSHIQRLGSFSEATSRFYAAELTEALDYLHQNGVLHRDIKPENVLVDDMGHVRITDFGTAKQLEKDQDDASSFVGTAEYVSPELLELKYTCRASDVWSMGCVLYHMLAGKVPFKGPNEYQTFQKVTKAPLEIPQELSEQAQDLLKKLLVRDPKKRLGGGGSKAGRPVKAAEEGEDAVTAESQDEPEHLAMADLKQHPFFTGVEWERLHLLIPPVMEQGLFKKQNTSSGDLLSHSADVSSSSIELEASTQNMLGDSRDDNAPTEQINTKESRIALDGTPAQTDSSSQAPQDASKCKLCLIL